MELPFSRAQFLEIFAEYNESIWPLQIFAAALGVAASVLLFLDRQWAGRAITGILAGLWAITGVCYHWIFFATINKAAYFFGGLFLITALIFAIEGVVRNRIRFRMTWNLRGWAAMALVAYSLVIYPVVGLLSTHPYPETPLFGVVPCPTTIFTLGLLMLASYSRPLLLGAAPLLWVLIGGSAAILLDVPQDWGLFVAGVLWMVAWLRARRAPDLRSAA